MCVCVCVVKLRRAIFHTEYPESLAGAVRSVATRVFWHESRSGDCTCVREFECECENECTCECVCVCACGIYMSVRVCVHI
jgi:hypothetical protein